MHLRRSPTGQSLDYGAITTILLHQMSRVLQVKTYSLQAVGGTIIGGHTLFLLLAAILCLNA
ncbi:hypothetical protein [Novosphingobium capsulatum]|uniref:hypothetical protein n=1 Tax=Novosphingobium capsulatum TaxID=13688 RepID=UPI00078732CD|nr:hypothetical protein [Novosphingobium capsulatum]WQD91438.1 hypothetical protein U0041_10450 [Novosphingobium capsulatum]